MKSFHNFNCEKTYIENNIASKSGGGLYIDSHSEYQLKESKIENNKPENIYKRK